MSSLIGWLRGRRGTPEEERAAEALERIIQLTTPRLRYARQYRKRLTPAVSHAMRYARELVAGAAPARQSGMTAWQQDPCIRSVFATPKEVAWTFSRSPEMQAWFAANPGAQETCAVLSMQLNERNVLGVAAEEGILRRDAPQTTVSFTDHRARICAATEAELREELERRIVDQLALTAMAAIARDGSRREVLERERALLRTRLRLLETTGAGVTGLGVRVNPKLWELARVQEELSANEEKLKGLGAGGEQLEHQLERLKAVLDAPAEHFSVSARRIRIDNMNVLLRDDGTEAGATLELQIASLPTPDGSAELRTFVLVRFPRAELLPKRELLAEAARTLH